MRPRRDIERDVLEAPVDGGDCRRLQLIDGLHVFLAADLRLEHLRAVDRRDERMAILHAAHVPGVARPPMFSLYSPSAGNRCSIQESAAGAQRQTFDVQRSDRCLARGR